MPIKTVLVQVGLGDHFNGALNVAHTFATRFEAHVDIAYTTRPLHMPQRHLAGRGGASGYIADQTALAIEKEDEVKAAMAERFKDLSWTMTRHDQHHAEALGERSHFADIAVVPVSIPRAAEQFTALEKPEELVLHAAVMAVVVPPEREVLMQAPRILVPWKKFSGADRVLRDSLRFLTGAGSVRVLMIEDSASRDGDGAGIKRFLTRHGIDAEVENAPAGDVAHAILDSARDHDSDGIVMGAFSHSRLHAQLFGSTTETVLRHAGVPVLISH